MKINIKEILGEQDEKPVSGGEETEVIQEKTEAPEEEDSREEKAPEVILQEEREMPEEASEAVGEEEETEETTEAEEEPGQEEPEAETEPVSQGEAAENTGQTSEEEPESEAEQEPEIENEQEPESETGRETEGEPAAEKADKGVDGKQLLKKYGWHGGIAASFAILLFSVFAYTNLVPREVHATINGEETTVMSKAYTIEGFLENENIEYCDEDYISKTPETFIYDGISFDLRHATDYTVTADGKTTEHKTLKRTVGDALAEEGIQVGERDIVTPSLDSKMGDNVNIVVQRVTVREEVKEETVAFKTLEKDDSSLDEGTSKVITEGKDGTDKVTYEVTYIDGVEASRKEVSRETVTAAVDKVVANGTRITFNGTSYSRKLVVKAYAYTGGGRTAMGTRARVGEIAVDPSVIPLGSTVYIEGVGARRAEDTGGNIKGNTIDIYMNTESQCRSWGVRYVTVYIK